MGAACSSGRTDLTAKPKVPSFKIVLVGQPEVGKTSVFNRFLKNQFDYSYRPTVDVFIESSVRKVNIPDNHVVAVTVWDLPGRDDVDLRKTYYRDVDAAVVVVDISDIASVELAASWKQEVVNNATVTETTHEVDAEGQPRVKVTHVPAPQGSIPIVLLGNKHDVVEEQFVKDKVEALTKKAQEEVETEVETIDKPFDEQIYSWEFDSLPETYRNKEKEIEMDSLIDVNMKKIKTPRNDDVIEEEEKDASTDEEDLPDIVKKFLEIGEDHGFISSCPVSAKSNDGSVGTAIQSLIRHLLEKHLGKTSSKKEKTKVVKLHKKRKEEKDLIKLDPVGVEELDDLYQRCYLPMKMINNFSKNYKSLLRNFRVACVEAELVTEKECPVSACVSGIKEEIEGDYHLKVEDDGCFLIISAEKTRELADDLDEDVNKCIVALQEVCNVCRAIAREVPGAKTFLTKLDNMIEDRAEDTAEVWKIEGRSDQEIRALGRAVEGHDAKVDAAIQQMEENLTMVMNMKNKIQNALMW